MCVASACGKPPVLLILTDDDCGNAIAAALDYAKAQGRQVRAFQILNSELYCYGHQDIVSTRPSKRQFLLYIREQVIQRSRMEGQALSEKAREMGVSLNIAAIESEDVISSSLAEAKKGYDVIFVPKQKKKLFPLFKRTLPESLQKKIPARIIAC